jgi:hypothetical protein
VEEDYEEGWRAVSLRAKKFWLVVASWWWKFSVINFISWPLWMFFQPELELFLLLQAINAVACLWEAIVMREDAWMFLEDKK